MEAERRRAGGRPSKNEANAINMRLLDGARAAFARNGIASTSLEEIAADLGMSKHTIYRRYPNKALLLEAVVSRDLVRFRGALAQAAAERTEPVGSLHNVALSYFTIGTNREYSAFYLSVSAEAATSPSMRDKLAVWTSAALEPLRDAVVSAQAAYALRPGDPASICNILVDLLEGANNRVRLGTADAPDDGASRLLFDERWDVFVAAMAPGGATLAAN
ncbi:TetR family transcriptional regulator [Rhizobium sp. Root1203]|uniref:TetR/AcrR family transcriptional regulator n=1 Tax=Rhizobium sp. Root1203 TaxID=1736427 RepID=UPI00070C224C|nr:TetR/AcrR family transcriptional regulator [Rhizobium sp. Root1203]KQV27003.1 TetR family transcriptional regulator [Rhizobium sp. Root1203]